MIKKLEIDLDLTPKEVAEAFWEMDNDAQANVFNYLAGFQNFQWQMNQVALSEELKGGCNAMQSIGLAVYGVKK
jgi:hypothetical protein